MIKSDTYDEDVTALYKAGYHYKDVDHMWEIEASLETLLKADQGDDFLSALEEVFWAMSPMPPFTEAAHVAKEYGVKMERISGEWAYWTPEELEEHRREDEEEADS